MQHHTIAFIGTGNMAGSLIGGLIANQYPTQELWVSNPTQEGLDSLKACFPINTTLSNREAVEKADIVIFAVKPDVLKSVVLELADILAAKKPLIISIVTGIRSEAILTWAGCEELSIIRCMPNTPALIRCGAAGLWANAYVTKTQSTLAESILRAVGVVLWVKNEEDLNIVTAVSGSGPAYFFLVMEVMIDCAKEMGLDERQAELLTINTAFGAAKMALESGKTVTTLRQQVTSPGGTTEEAIKVFEAYGLRETFEKALKAAKEKAIKMSHLLD